MRTIIGLFDTIEDARGAASELHERGLPEAEIKLMRCPPEHGQEAAEGALLAVRADDATRARVEEAMGRHGVIDIARRSADWRIEDGWRSNEGDYSVPRTNRDPSAYEDPDPSAPRVRRDHRDETAGEAWQDSSKVGTAAGAMTGAATGAAIGALGGPAGAIIGGALGAAVGAGAGAAGDVAGERSIPADEYRGVNEYDDDTRTPRELHEQQGDSFARHEGDFYSHYQTTWPGGMPYAEYAPAYRFGYTMAGDRRFFSGGWGAAEPELRRLWEQDRPGSWAEFSPAVRYAWEQAREAR